MYIAQKLLCLTDILYVQSVHSDTPTSWLRTRWVELYKKWGFRETVSMVECSNKSIGHSNDCVCVCVCVCVQCTRS